MPHLIKVANLSDVPPGERLLIDLEDETVAIFNIDGRLHCIADLCSHDGGPVAEGELDGYQIACPRHGALFDIRTGAALSMPAVTPIPAYEVKVEGEEIYILKDEDY